MMVQYTTQTSRGLASPGHLSSPKKGWTPTLTLCIEMIHIVFRGFNGCPESFRGLCCTTIFFYGTAGDMSNMERCNAQGLTLRFHKRIAAHPTSQVMRVFNKMCNNSGAVDTVKKQIEGT